MHKNHRKNASLDFEICGCLASSPDSRPTPAPPTHTAHGTRHIAHRTSLIAHRTSHAHTIALLRAPPPLPKPTLPPMFLDGDGHKIAGVAGQHPRQPCPRPAAAFVGGERRWTTRPLGDVEISPVSRLVDTLARRWHSLAASGSGLRGRSRRQIWPLSRPVATVIASPAPAFTMACRGLQRRYSAAADIIGDRSTCSRADRRPISAKAAGPGQWRIRRVHRVDAARWWFTVIDGAEIKRTCLGNAPKNIVEWPDS